MTGFRHILFPVDFSERCEGAVPFVESMARRFQAKLTLISVAQTHYLGTLDDPSAMDPQAIIDAVHAHLNRSFADDFKGLPVSRITQLGDPGHVIAAFVKTHGVDLVMIPSHGRGPFRQLLLGSVTAKVLHDVECPVWTTAHTGTAPDLEHVKLKKILCAVDGTEQGVRLMQSASAFSKQVAASLRLVNVVPGIEAWPERRMDMEFEEGLRNHAKNRIEIQEQSAGIDAPLCVAVGAVADTVAAEAQRHGADLIVIGRGAAHATLGRLRTHAHAIIRQSPCPVLSI